MKEEYAEMIELLEPVLYSLPTVADVIRKKSAEFQTQRERGVTYSREQLLDEAMKSFGEVIEYFVDQAGKKGLLGRMLAKKASTYLTKSLTDVLFG